MSTIAEKVLGGDSGEIVEREVDYIMVNDVTGVPAFEVFEEFDVSPMVEKIVVIQDHYVPNKDVLSAIQAKALKDYAKKYGIKYYYEVGRGGVCHQVMIEDGFAAPGRLIIGADSHTCSYGALGAFSTGTGSTEAACAMATGKLWFKIPDTQKFVVDGEMNKYVSGKDVILHIIGDIGVSGSLYKSRIPGYCAGSKKLPVSLEKKITYNGCVFEVGILKFDNDFCVIRYISPTNEKLENK